MAVFLGSGKTILERTYEAIYDRFEEDCSDLELRASSESFGAAACSTLDEVGYSVTPSGAIILDNDETNEEPVWKKTKLPAGTKYTSATQKGECGICFMPIDAAERVETACHHEYCRDCMAYYLSVETGDITKLEHVFSDLECGDDGRVRLWVEESLGVVCPHPTCQEIITAPYLSQFATPATVERFETLCLKIALKKLQERGLILQCPAKCGGYMQNCLCSNVGCAHRKAMLAQRRRDRLHELYLQSVAALAALASYAHTHHARQCPNCKMLIEKNGGCDHMFCSNCKTRYNWSDSALHVNLFSK